METKIHTQLNDDLHRDWTALWQRSPHANYFNSPYWLQAALEAYRYEEFRVIAVYRSDKLVAVQPLVKQHRYGLDIYTLPADYVCGIPFLSETLAQNIVKALTDAMVSLGTVFIDEVQEQAMLSFVKSNRKVSSLLCSTVPTLVLRDENGNNVLHLRRSEILRKTKYVFDKISFDVYSGDDERGVELAFQIDEHSAKSRDGYNNFSDSQTRHFFRSLAKLYGAKCITTILRIEAKPVAYVIGFLVGDIFYYSQTAYHKDYAQYSPGKAIIVYTIDHLLTTNAKVFDFGSGDTQHKRKFTKTAYPLYKVILSPNPAVRYYIKGIYYLKNESYKLLRNNMKVYGFYRNFRKLLRL